MKNSSFLKTTSIRKVLNIWNGNTLLLKRKFKHRVSIELNTDFMIDDPLTKGLPSKTFIGHVKNMGITSTSE